MNIRQEISPVASNSSLHSVFQPETVVLLLLSNEQLNVRIDYNETKIRRSINSNTTNKDNILIFLQVPRGTSGKVKFATVHTTATTPTTQTNVASSVDLKR